MRFWVTLGGRLFNPTDTVTILIKDTINDVTAGTEAIPYSIRFSPWPTETYTTATLYREDNFESEAIKDFEAALNKAYEQRRQQHLLMCRVDKPHLRPIGKQIRPARQTIRTVAPGYRLFG